MIKGTTTIIMITAYSAAACGFVCYDRILGMSLIIAQIRALKGVNSTRSVVFAWMVSTYNYHNPHKAQREGFEPPYAFAHRLSRPAPYRTRRPLQRFAARCS